MNFIEFLTELGIAGRPVAKLDPLNTCISERSNEVVQINFAFDVGCHVDHQDGVADPPLVQKSAGEYDKSQEAKEQSAKRGFF